MNDIRARAKEQLPSVLLTLMSIIQALALEFLWEVVRIAPRVFTWDAVLEWLQIAAVMLGILQLWMFYTSAAMRFRWTPTTQDLLFPFLIGILEFTLIDLTGEDLALWFWMLAILYAIATWDTQIVMVRARKDPDNRDFFSTVRPAGLVDLVEPMVAVSCFVAFGVAVYYARENAWVALAGLVFAVGNLVWRLLQGRHYWNRSMQEP